MADPSTESLDLLFSIPELEATFIFRRRPIAVPGDLRPTWRIGFLVLLLASCCRQQRSSLTRLHVLNWASRSQAHVEDLISLIEDRLTPDALFVRFDPAINRAIDFAVAEGLVKHIDGARVELTDAGKAFAKEIFADSNVYVAEKKLTDLIRYKVSEQLVDSIFGAR